LYQPTFVVVGGLPPMVHVGVKLVHVVVPTVRSVPTEKASSVASVSAAER
jgi:hypothetical protein